MKVVKFLQGLWLTGSVVVLFTNPANSQEVQGLNERSYLLWTATDKSSNQSLPLTVKAQPVKPIKDILRLSEIELPPRSAQKLVQSPAPSSLPTNGVVEITGVKVNPTDKGVEIILETPKGEQLQVLPKSEGNSYIVDIPNTQLRLPTGGTFNSRNPVAGITTISVTNQDANTIRVTAIGETGVPQFELFDSDEGLIFGFTPTTSSAQTPPSLPQTPTPPTQPTQQPESETKPEKPVPGNDEPIELLVTGEQDGYLVPNSITGTRTDTPVLDIPQSVQVIPQQVLKDQQVTSLEEAVRNVSGVFGDSSEGRGFSFNIRGFEGAPVLRDGFRAFGLNGNQDSQSQSFAEIANIERVEVLKGPASILFGQIEPGGLVNAVTKKPLNEPFYEAELQVGSRGFVRPRIDISGPLTSDRSLLYRLNALYLRDDGFRNFDTDIQRYFVAPSVTWKIGDRTDLNFQLEYLNDQRPYDTGLVAFRNKVADIPRDRILNEPDDVIQKESLNVGYNLEHRFSKNWTLRNGFKYNRDDDFIDSVLNLGFLGRLNESTGQFNRILAIQDIVTENYSLQTNVVGKFNTGSIGHTLLFGVDLGSNNIDQVTNANFSASARFPINIFNPVYRSFSRRRQADLPLAQDFQIRVNSLGIYLQDQVSLTDNLLLSAGVRYETIEQKTTNNPSSLNLTSSETTQNDDAFSPRFGIVYKPVKNLSLYTSYSRSFVPNSGITVNNGSLEPEQGEGYEVGAKAELLQGNLLTTLAYFDVTKQNVATADPNNTFFSVATGEQRSRGIELDITGKILPGWNIIASYSYIDTEITNDNRIPSIVGNNLPGVPQHSASLWTNYEIQQGNLQGLGLGIGFNFVSNRQGDLDNSFELDSYFLTNASISYRRNNWRAALNFKNLFDVNYITGTPTSRARGIEPGEPFTMIGSISVQF
jgi:iron complex outermembrane receptor protein